MADGLETNQTFKNIAKKIDEERRTAIQTAKNKITIATTKTNNHLYAENYDRLIKSNQSSLDSLEQTEIEKKHNLEKTENFIRLQG